MTARRRLAWRCRRGMKELDVLLEPFVASGLSEVPESELADLEQLLEAQDTTLLSWLTGSESPPADELRRQVERIRAASRR